MISVFLFATWFCDIKGAVKNPGVYQISNNVIINDVIKNAGGLTNDADLSRINLSKKVYDEMVIYIPIKTKKCTECICKPKIIYKECPNIITTTTTVITSKINETLININTAIIDELTSLKGIGVSIAQRIIDYRQTNLFTHIEDIKNVKGIGDSVFAQIKDYITV